MSKTFLLTIPSLAFIFLSTPGMAEIHKDAFAGCVSEVGDYEASCKELCNRKYQHVINSSATLDKRPCPRATPYACLCEYDD